RGGPKSREGPIVFPGRSFSEPVPAWPPLRHGRVRRAYLFALSRISGRPADRAASGTGPAPGSQFSSPPRARRPQTGTEKNFGLARNHRGLAPLKEGAGWRAPSPPTPHPSGEQTLAL